MVLDLGSVSPNRFSCETTGGRLTSIGYRTGVGSAKFVCSSCSPCKAGQPDRWPSSRTCSASECRMPSSGTVKGCSRAALPCVPPASACSRSPPDDVRFMIVAAKDAKGCENRWFARRIDTRGAIPTPPNGAGFPAWMTPESAAAIRAASAALSRDLRCANRACRGNREDIDTRILRTLTSTCAAIFSSCVRIVPNCACAISVPAAARLRTTSIGADPAGWPASWPSTCGPRTDPAAAP